MVKRTKLLLFSLTIVSIMNSCREDAVDFTDTQLENINRKVLKTKSESKRDSIQKTNFENENDPIRDPKPPIK